MGELIREKGIPLYLQLADELRKQIEEGKLKENEKVLTEKELSEKYDVSRITVRKAMEILTDEDLLTRKQGVGTFVTGKKLVRNLNSLMSFSQNCIQNGEKPGTKFLSADIVNAMPSDVKYLHIQKGEKVIRIRRLRYCNDVPVMLEENHFPRSFAFLLSEDLNQPLFSTLAAHNVILKTGTKKIGICYATKEEAQELDVKENEALLYMWDTCADAEGTPVYYGKNIINADRFTYILQLDVDEDGK